jgi:hypothetical protein
VITDATACIGGNTTFFEKDFNDVILKRQSTQKYLNKKKRFIVYKKIYK